VHVAVEDLDDARVLDARGGARFIEEARDDVLVARHLREQELDRGEAIDVAVLGEENLAHPPGAEPPTDHVGPYLSPRG